MYAKLRIQLEGERGCLAHIVDVLGVKGHAVIVLGEGAGIQLQKLAGESKDANVDAGGNVKLPDAGEWLKDQVTRT